MHRYARDMHDICTHMHRYIHFPLGYAAKWPCMYLYVSVGMCMYVILSANVYVSVFMRMYVHVSSRRAYQFSQMHMCKNACICMYHVRMLYVCVFFACIWYVSCMCQYVYVLYVLAQTNTLTNITWPTDLLKSPQHAGPTQGRDEHVPIYFVPPSKTTCHTRFGALPGAAHVEEVQLGFRVSPTGLPWAVIHWWYLVKTFPSWSAWSEQGHEVMSGRCQHEKTPPNPVLTMCICICICMYIYVYVCIRIYLLVLSVCVCMSLYWTLRYRYRQFCPSIRCAVGPVGRSDTRCSAGGCSSPRIFSGVLFLFGTFLTVDCSVPSPGLSRHFPFACWTKQKITYMHIHTHTTSYIHIQAYTYIYIYDTIIYIHMSICECMWMYLHFACMCMYWMYCMYLYISVCICKNRILRYIHIHTIHTHTDICTWG